MSWLATQEGKPDAEEHARTFSFLGDPRRLRPLVVASLSAAVTSYRRQEAQALFSPPQEPYVAPLLRSLLANVASEEEVMAVAAGGVD